MSEFGAPESDWPPSCLGGCGAADDHEDLAFGGGTMVVNVVLGIGDSRGAFVVEFHCIECRG